MREKRGGYWVAVVREVEREGGWAGVWALRVRLLFVASLSVIAVVGFVNAFLVGGQKG